MRRVHQFANLKLMILSIPPQELRFVTHTDSSSKDQDGTDWTHGGYIIGATDPSMGAGNTAPWSPLVWKSHKLKQGCTSALASEAKVLSSGLGHLEWVMCMFATVLFTAFCLENRDVYIQRLSAISVVTKPGAPTDIDGVATIRGCLRR